MEHAVEAVTGTEPAKTSVPPRDAAEELAPGQLVGDFRIERKLGAGGTCIVYAATHHTIGKRAAVKVLRRSLIDVPLAIDQFAKEGQVANAISHPNVAGVFGFGHLPDGRPYMLMELLPGQTLRRLMAAGAIALGEVLRIAKQVCTGLEAVHAAGYVHGDVKPDNIFLTTDDAGAERVVLIDFGTSRPAPDAEPSVEVRASLIFGTLPYMAPEQRRGFAARPASDVYSLGVVLYKMLVGRRPFQGSDETFATAENIREVDLVPPADAAPDTPRPLSDVIVGMLKTEPTERPRLAAVRAVLDHCAARRPTAPRAIPEVARALPATARAPAFDTTRAARLPRAWVRPAIVGAIAALAVVALAVPIAGYGISLLSPAAQTATAVGDALPEGVRPPSFATTESLVPVPASAPIDAPTGANALEPVAEAVKAIATEPSTPAPARTRTRRRRVPSTASRAVDRGGPATPEPAPAGTPSTPPPDVPAAAAPPSKPVQPARRRPAHQRESGDRTIDPFQ